MNWRPRAGAAMSAVLLSALSGTACRTRPMPAWDLSAPGWERRESAAVWRPGRRSDEVAGELLVAGHPDGSRLVQFSKQGVPLVVARAAPTGWEIGSPLRHGTLRGSGRPPARVVWFRIHVSGPSPDGADGLWTARSRPDGGWTLENRRTGERLEGVP